MSTTQTVRAPARFRSLISPKLIHAGVRFENYEAVVTDQARVDEMLASIYYGNEFILGATISEAQEHVAQMQLPAPGPAPEPSSTPNVQDTGADSEQQQAGADATAKPDAEPHTGAKRGRKN